MIPFTKLKKTIATCPALAAPHSAPRLVLLVLISDTLPSQEQTTTDQWGPSTRPRSHGAAFTWGCVHMDRQADGLSPWDPTGCSELEVQAELLSQEKALTE